MANNGYYAEKLSASRLRRCYEIAPPRIKQYLEAEIQYVLTHIRPTDVVLELGCGYGRVLVRLTEKKVKKIYGIDTSESSLRYARKFLPETSNIELYIMNAKALDFKDKMFDVVILIQNGISAFNVDPHELIRESLRVTKDDGIFLLSSYSENIWEARLEWFILQSEEGLLGEIDLEKTGDGVIVCKDGFKATTYTPEDFSRLMLNLNLNATIEEVDKSSIFCVIHR